MSKIVAAEPTDGKLVLNKCIWRNAKMLNMATTACNEIYVVSKESTPVSELNYCPFCGRTIVIKHE